MPVRHIPCAPAANQSETKAIERLKSALPSEWMLLSNLQLVAGQDWQPCEIDLIAAGPAGVLLIEVKHWNGAWIRENPDKAEDEARILKSKAQRLGALLRRELPGLGVHVRQFFLLTREGGAQAAPAMLAGAPVWTLKSLAGELAKLEEKRFSEAQVKCLVETMEPRARMQTDGKLRNVGDFKNLELQSPGEDRFHRVYKAQHRRTNDKVVLHLYDLAASQEKDPRRLAEREFRVLQELQKCRYVPRTRDSFQDLAGFPGEMCLFSIFDPSAPSLKRRGADTNWTEQERLDFAISCADALAEIHGTRDEQDTPVIHRNISPDTILVGARNRPIITGFEIARAVFTDTLPPGVAESAVPDWIAPEIASGGLAKASVHSDVHALCFSLLTIFPEGSPAWNILNQKLGGSPETRGTASGLKAEMENLGEPAPDPLPAQLAAIPHSDYWCEGTEIPFHGMRLEVVSSLGVGGIGRTFKVMGRNPHTAESYGTYVAKIIRNEENARRALEGYRRVRVPSSGPEGLATVYEVAEEWGSDRIMALFQWLDQEPLSGMREGLLGLALQDSGAGSLEELMWRWARDGCEALAALHGQGLVHGDVSPRNLIYSKERLRLTDYDLVTPAGSPSWAIGAPAFCSPEAAVQAPLAGSDDVFALAASLFSVAFDTDAPFRQPDGSQDSSRGLCWPDDGREAVGGFAGFFDRATSPERGHRFADAQDALRWLDSRVTEAAAAAPETRPVSVPEPPEPEPSRARTPNHVPWLDSLLSVYPGAPGGNDETRGLDTEFASATYVPTALEEELVDHIREHRLRLLILCGNAGDGKTALLQRIAKQFGADRLLSEQRVWEHQSPDGPRLKANLDGSAAWKVFSSDQLLDQILLPFLDGPPGDQSVHLLAINDGRLFQWLDDKQKQGLKGDLLDSLENFLAHDDDAALPEYFRFISLNHRSLVGGRTGDGKEDRRFIDDLITALLGGEKAGEIWRPCLSCSAWNRCHAGPTAQLLLESGNGKGRRIRQRIQECLQAVHQRGNIHITARELRGALSYLLFGVRSCIVLHGHPEWNLQAAGSGERLGDMAFNPDSPHRQGELLRELAELDPALEAHCDLDRHLAGGLFQPQAAGNRDAARALLESARRQAYFELAEDELVRIGRAANALTLAGGRFLAEFRKASEGLAQENENLCARIVRGISHLEDLPQIALQRAGRAALRLPSRTPTETKFWVELDLSRFRLEPDLPRNLDPAVPRLARQLQLIYSRAGEAGEETLPMGYQLFATLLLLEGGEQLTDVRSDDLFANLQIFTQRVSRENSRSIWAWNPKEDDRIGKLELAVHGKRQVLVLKPDPATEQS